MSVSSVELGPATFWVRGYPGDDLTIVVLMSDFTSGPYDFDGATITAAVGGLAMGVEDSLGRLELTLTAAQTTTLGRGQHTWVLATTEDGTRQTWVHGRVELLTYVPQPSSIGYDSAVVNNVLVGVG